jgi:predicted nucleic acid-binding protein
MRVFVDTNVLLNLYHLSGPDLDEVKKILKLAENKQIDLLVPQQVADEFWRNRERVIRDALDTFAKTKAQAFLPNIVRVNPKSAELKKAVDLVNNLAKTLREETEQTIQEQKLAADKLVESLLEKCELIAPEVVERARLRKQLGNPPGKADSLGDAVNWEWLLSKAEDWDELIVISTDGDFESELTPSEPKEFLRREWQKVTSIGSLSLYKGLPEFLKAHFPEIKLSDEIDKLAAIERLEKSLSFAATHRAIARLDQFDDFNDNDIARLAKAYDKNDQIFMIFGDSDVKAFAKKLLSLAKSDAAKKAVEPVELLFSQIEEEDDEDIPF